MNENDIWAFDSNDQLFFFLDYFLLVSINIINKLLFHRIFHKMIFNPIIEVSNYFIWYKFNIYCINII